MSIYIKEATLNHSALMPLNTQPKDSVLATCQTLIFISPLIVVDPYTSSTDKDYQLSGSGVVRLALPPVSKGVLEIAHILDQCPRVQTLHIYTTGSPGRLNLGQDTLTTETVERYSWELQSWFSRLPTYIKPSLVLGHCNVGDGYKGVIFVEQLRYLTGCHIRCLCSSNNHHLQLM